MIDANALVAGNQAFTFIGSAAFSSAAGELRFANGVLRGDVDGDGMVDFLVNLHGITSLTASDILL